jgi:DHA2 family multidrug resistance protein-like MFS transporter
MAPVLLGLVTFGLSVSMGSAMAPATDSVTSAVPEAKAGVGSAMSDVTRQVGGALGVAIVGSIISSAYVNRLPADAPDAAGDSIGAAHRVGESLGGSHGADLIAAANGAFTDALGIGFLAAASVALVAAALVAWRLPDNDAGIAPAPEATSDELAFSPAVA